MERAPNTEERKVCWDARDAHFKCLQENNEDVESCKQTFEKFNQRCPKRWVKYFANQRRKEQIRIKLQTEGAVFADGKK